MESQTPQQIQQFLSTILSQRTLPYPETLKWHIRNQIVSLSAQFPSLTPKTATYTHTDGRSVTLLQAHGTVPTLYLSVTYNIPIVIWILESFPTHPPLVYVNPTRDMVIKRPHPFVDPSGVVAIPYLQNWIFPASNLVQMAREMSEYFGRDPPVYSQRPRTEAAVENNSLGFGRVRPVVPPPRTYSPSPYRNF